MEEFALTFNGYEHVHGGVEELHLIADAIRTLWELDGILPRSVDKLRTALFFVQRQHHHWGEPPDETEMDYVRALVATICAISR
jgi:hypothetical protein